MEVRRVLRPYSDKFSKKTYTQHQHATAILLMRYEDKTYRDVTDLFGIPLGKECLYIKKNRKNDNGFVIKWPVKSRR